AGWESSSRAGCGAGGHRDRPRIARPWPHQAFSPREGWGGRGVGGHDRRPVRGRAGGDVGSLSDAAVPGHDADRSAVDLTPGGPRRMGAISHRQETWFGLGWTQGGRRGRDRSGPYSGFRAVYRLRDNLGGGVRLTWRSAALRGSGSGLEATPRIELGMEVLQNDAGPSPTLAGCR